MAGQLTDPLGHLGHGEPGRDRRGGTRWARPRAPGPRVEKLLFFEKAYDPGCTAGTLWNWLQIR